jgi:hypothetical protein
MLSGALYIASDDELTQHRRNARRLLSLFNQTSEDESDKRIDYLSELFGSIKENIWIEPSFHVTTAAIFLSAEIFTQITMHYPGRMLRNYW